jgi:hypothetical protein
VDLSPFAGLLGGSHTISLTVANNAGYWLLTGSLFLYEDNGVATSGKLLSNTLTTPTSSTVTTTNIEGNSSNPLYNEDASTSYKIQGEVKTAYGDWTATVNSSLTFANDQTNINPQYWQIVHGLQDVKIEESLATNGQTFWTRSSDESYTLDATSAYIQPDSSSSDYFLPADVTQTLNEVHSVSGKVPWGWSTYKGRGYNAEPGSYHSTLFETIQGYAALQRTASNGTITNGATSAFASFEDSLGTNFREVLEARGGVIVLKQITGSSK